MLHSWNTTVEPVSANGMALSIFCKQDVLMVCKRVVNENVGDMMDAA